MTLAAQPIPRHSIYLRYLRYSLVAGAIYDLCFAAVMLIAPEIPARLLNLPVPQENFYLWLIAVFLTMLAAFYGLAAYDPIAYSGNIYVAILGRTAGAAVFVLATFGRPDLSGLYVVAAGDFLFALLHALCWFPIRR